MAIQALNFLSLPPELRNRICDFYFAADTALPPPPIETSPLALPSTCRQLYHETHTLAVSATTFRTRSWNLVDLRSHTKHIRPDYGNIKRLEITVDLFSFLKSAQSLGGLRFAEAGLTTLEELYINFIGAYESEYREEMMISNLEVVLWKTIIDRTNDSLKKVRLVHGGILRWHGISELCTGMDKRQAQIIRRQNSNVVQEMWEIREDLKEGQFKVVQKARDEIAERKISILLGPTAREAEL